MKYRPEILVLSSGSEKGMAEIGALISPYENNILDNIKTIIGCSVGAIIGYLYAIGFTPTDIMALGLGIKIFDENKMKLGKAEYAFCDHDIVMDKIRDITLHKIKYIPTFLDLWNNFGIRLITPTVNITKDRPDVVYLDYTNNPNMSCLEAVKRSISIQPLFPPVKDGDDIYVDGAIIDPFPINLLDNGKNEILGIHTEVLGGHCSNFLEHISLITNILVDEIKNLKIKNASDKVKLITVKLKNSVITDGVSSRLTNFFEGYFEGIRFVENIKRKNNKHLKAKFD